MGIFHDLIRTYDANVEYAGVPTEKGEPLCPVSHFIYNAQIEIVLNKEGSFITAKAVSKEEQRTIIPVTEASSSRTNNPKAAHPLCEQLEYLIPQKASVKHEAYLKALAAWHDSEDNHAFVDAVYSYISAETIIEDLVQAGVVCPTEDGDLAKGKINGTDYSKCLVRWRIEDNESSIASWECLPLFEAYQRYYNKHGIKKTGVCCLTGEVGPLASVFDKGLVLSCNGAKLISANDASGFTYRGRTSEPWQTAQVGYIAAQKMHRALRWLANHNGVYVGSRLYVAWCPTENVHINPAILFDETDNATVMNVSDYRAKLYKAIRGYAMQLPEDAEVILASFDAATTGRLSVTQYCPLNSSDFLNRLQNWYETCCWPHFYFGIKTPRVWEFANYVYGNQRKQLNGNAMMEANEAVIKTPIQQLYNCMTYGTSLSYDMVKGLVGKAQQLHCYPQNIRENLLMMACAAFRKYENDKARKEVWSMALDKEKRDRSYQFGRLLAIYEKIERDTYGDAEKREPQAMRLQAAYIDRPMRTAMILQRSIGYYLEKQRIPTIRQWYRNMIDQAMAIISEFHENELDKRLEGSYLLGYSLQRIELTSRKRKQEEESDDE